MNCELAHSTVHGYFDGELDAVRSAEFERHLEKCAECQSTLQGLESLHTRFQKADIYQHASSGLRDRVYRQTGGAHSDPVRPQPRRWFLIPALAVVTAALIAVLVLLPGHRETERITAELIDAHVRSLQPGHLMDVQSTDQHTVKPWFDGKLDFIPPVSDYSPEGFPLVGGRLDVLDGHDVAALVYSRRKHFINVFVWPYRGKESRFATSGLRQGYNWTTWQSRDMRFCAVSDAAAEDLRQLRDLMER